ncbi:ATP-binding protein [Xanthomonas sacchari]|uniref:ATP-binding protein n=1 Tax=Xanthomonas sacchari TaxID=56458 RepID=UPI0022582A34|nr:ATP-binding protein [Xanthomonas sacchari]MCW0463263.1 hypothetical protein [Xanthomonas sacchari]
MEIVDSTVSSLVGLEKEIRNIQGHETTQARHSLLVALRGMFGEQGCDMTVADLLRLLPMAERKKGAAIVVRCLNVHGLMPEPTQANGLARTVVDLCEKELPELVAFLRIDSKEQTFRKFDVLAVAHQKICEYLASVWTRFVDVEGALSSRKAISGSMNHSAVRAYCSAFGLDQVRLVVNEVYSKLATVSQLNPTLLVDIEECKSAISEGKTIAQELGTFLSEQFLLSFLINVEEIIDAFLYSSKSKFETRIVSKVRAFLQKRYPFHEPERILPISIPFSNLGPGLAKGTTVTVSTDSQSIMIDNPNINLGNVPPGDFAVIIDVMVLESLERCNIIIHIEWSEIGGNSSKSEVFEVTATAQSSTVDWSAHEYWSPYSPDPAQGENFVGRSEKVKSLATKLLRSPMENFYITGQKRVGKTSLALAAIAFAESVVTTGADVLHRYVLWGHIAHEDPRISLQMLGQEIDQLICSASSDLRLFDPSDFLGSLASLSRKAELAAKVCPKVKFVIVVDEFDEIHQELYLRGNLAETFFANLRALSRCSNICLVLVGGENMPFIMDRQGQKLNNFSRFNLSYYDRQSEWNDFRLLVEQPTNGVLKWHEDAISEIFNLCNGNPYFAKILCAVVLRTAIQERDTDVSADEVQTSSQLEVSALGANSFAHLWQDGIPKEAQDREAEILIRVRVLVAIARCLRRGKAIDLSNIATSRGIVQISESEISAVLNDFVRRDVISETNDGYVFKLPIFERWLVDVGSAQLVADSLSEELAQSFLEEERLATVRSEEVVELVRKWPTYRGKHITADDVRAWLRQRESDRDQRILFEILKKVRFYNEPRIREHLSSAFSFVLPLLSEFVIRRASDRRSDVLITYVDGEGKSGATYATLFAEENKISTKNIVPPGEFEKRGISLIGSKELGVKAIVIVDDIAATGTSLSRNLQRFFDSNRSHLVDIGIPVRVITVLATDDGRRKVERTLADFEGLDIDLRVCEILRSDAEAFPAGVGFWKDQETYERAKALCTDLGANIYRQSPLGHGGLGLLVVLPTAVPNNTLPILHSPSRSGVQKWSPLFARIIH